MSLQRPDAGVDNFEFTLTDEFAGYNSAVDKTKINKAFLIRGSKNVYKKLSGNIASRPGLKRRGAADSTIAGVKSSYEWETRAGTTRVLRVADNKLQIESDIVTSGTYVWYDLLLTSTLTNPAASLTRFVFDSWWDNNDKSERLLMVRGDSNMLYWSGGLAKVASTTATTITKSGSTTWAEEGFAITISGEKKIIIDGAEYTYTGGEDTDTLSGVTPDPSAIPVDSLAIQSVFIQGGGGGDMFPTTYSADFIKTVGNQVWVGSYNSRVIYISADQTVSSVLGFLNYSNDASTSLIPGDPDQIVLDRLARGIGEKEGKVYIFGGTSDLYVVTPNSLVPTAFAVSGVTTSRYVIQQVDKKILPSLNSALAHEFIGNYGEHLVWLDQNNQLRSIGVFLQIDTIRPAMHSLAVQEELSEEDFTGGHLRVVGDTIHITAPNTGRDWMYQQRERIADDGQVNSEKLWHPPQIRGISRYAVIDGILYGHSNVNPQIYQVWDTNQWFDDSPTDEPIPYTCVARFPYVQNNRRQGMIGFDKIFFEGYAPEGLELLANVYIDYKGSTALQNVTITSADSPARFWSGNNASSLGDSSLGDNPLGDGIIEESNEQELLPKFRATTNITQNNCFEYSIEVYSTTVDSRWELICFGPNAKLVTEQAVFLQK